MRVRMMNEGTNDEDAPITQPDNVGDNNNLQPQPLAQAAPAQQGGADPSGQGVVDLCVQQGLSVNTCNNFLSKNPGGACQ